MNLDGRLSDVARAGDILVRIAAREASAPVQLALRQCRRVGLYLMSRRWGSAVGRRAVRAVSTFRIGGYLTCDRFAQHEDFLIKQGKFQRFYQNFAGS